MTVSYERPERVEKLRTLFRTLGASKTPPGDTFLGKSRAETPAAPIPTAPPFRLVTQEIRRAYDPGAFVIWRNITGQPEIFNALSNVVFYPVEAIGALFASQGAEQALLEAGETAGSPRTVCSFIKSIQGGTRLDMFPVPNMIITVAKGCEGLGNTFAHAARHYRVPMFTVHVPYDAPEAESLPYVTAQVREAVRRVEDLKGEKIEPDRLRATLETAEETYALFREAVALRSRYPFLDPMSVYQSLTIGTSSFYGHRHLLDYAREMVAAYRNRLATDPGVRRQPERRLMWMFLTPYFPNDLIEYMERDGRIRFVWEDISELDFKHTDFEDPYRSTALGLIRSRESVRPEIRFKLLMKHIRDHRVDGVVIGGMPYCGTYNFQYPIFQRMFGEADIPALILDICCVDSRTYHTGQIRTRVDAFCESLLKRPRRWPEIPASSSQDIVGMDTAGQPARSKITVNL